MQGCQIISELVYVRSLTSFGGETAYTYLSVIPITFADSVIIHVADGGCRSDDKTRDALTPAVHLSRVNHPA